MVKEPWEDFFSDTAEHVKRVTRKTARQELARTRRNFQQQIDGGDIFAIGAGALLAVVGSQLIASLFQPRRTPPAPANRRAIAPATVQADKQGAVKLLPADKPNPRRRAQKLPRVERLTDS